MKDIKKRVFELLDKKNNPAAVPKELQDVSDKIQRQRGIVERAEKELYAVIESGRTADFREAKDNLDTQKVYMRLYQNEFKRLSKELGLGKPVLTKEGCDELVKEILDKGWKDHSAASDKVAALCEQIVEIIQADEKELQEGNRLLWIVMNNIYGFADSKESDPKTGKDVPLCYASRRQICPQFFKRETDIGLFAFNQSALGKGSWYDMYMKNKKDSK